MLVVSKCWWLEFLRKRPYSSKWDHKKMLQVTKKFPWHHHMGPAGSAWERTIPLCCIQVPGAYFDSMLCGQKYWATDILHLELLVREFSRFWSMFGGIFGRSLFRGAFVRSDADVGPGPHSPLWIMLKVFNILQDQTHPLIYGAPGYSRAGREKTFSPNCSHQVGGRGLFTFKISLQQILTPRKTIPQHYLIQRLRGMTQYFCTSAVLICNVTPADICGY